MLRQLSLQDIDKVCLAPLLPAAAEHCRRLQWLELRPFTFWDASTSRAIISALADCIESWPQLSQVALGGGLSFRHPTVKEQIDSILIPVTQRHPLLKQDL